MAIANENNIGMAIVQCNECVCVCVYKINGLVMLNNMEISGSVFCKLFRQIIYLPHSFQAELNSTVFAMLNLEAWFEV